MNLAEEIFGLESPARNAPELYPDLDDIFYSFYILWGTSKTDMGVKQPISIVDMKIIYDEFHIGISVSFRTYMHYMLRMSQKMAEIVKNKNILDGNK